MRKHPILIGAGFFFCLLVALLAAGLFYVNTHHAATLLQRLINESIPGNVSWGKSYLSPITGTFEIKKVLIHSARGEKIVGVDRVFLKLSLTDLLKRRLVVTDLVIERPDIDLSVEKDGELNLIRAFSRAPEKEDRGGSRNFAFEIPIVLNAFTWSDAALRYTTSRGTWRLDIRKWDVSAQADLFHQAGNASLSLTDGFIQGPDMFTKIDRLKINILGPLGNPEADLDIRCGKGALFNLPVESVEMKISLNDRLVSVKQADIRAFSGLFKILGQIDFKGAFARGFLSSPVDLDKMVYSLSIQHQGVDIARLSQNSADLKGIIDGKVFLSGKGASLSALSGNVEMEMHGRAITTGPYQDPSDWNVRGKADISNKKARLLELTAVSGDLKFQSAGAIDFRNDEANARLLLNLPDVRTVLAPLGVKNSKGNLDIKIDASGSIKRPIFDLKLEGRNLAASGFSLGDLKVDAKLNPDGRIDLLKIDVKNQDAAINGNGSLKLFEKDFHLDHAMPLILALDFYRFEPGLFFKKSPVAGEINGRVTAKGPLHDLAASLELNGKKLVFEEIRIGDADAAIQFDRGRLSIGRAKLVNRNSTMDIKGDIDLFKKGSFTWTDDPIVNLDIESRKLFFEDFYDKAKGKFSFDAHARGSVKNPEGNVHLAGTDILFQGLRVKKMEMTCQMEDGKLTVANLGIFPDADSFIHGTGWISLEKQFQFTLASRGITLSQLPLIKKTHPVQGEIFFNIAGAGSFQNPEVNGQAGLTQVRVNGKHLPDFNFSLDVKDQVVRIKANPGFDIAGSYHLAEKTFFASADFQNTDLSPIFSFLDEAPAAGNIIGNTIGNINGTVNGTIRLGGKAGDPKSYTGSININRLQLRYKDETIVHSGVINVLLKQQELSIGGFHLDLADDKHLDLFGKANYNGPVSVTAKGNIPLSAIRLFSDDFADAAGEVSFEAGIRGEYANPEVEGEIRLADIAATIPFLSQNLHHVNGRIRIFPEKIVIDSLVGQLDDGRFSVAGDMALVSLAPSALALDIKADSLPVKIPDTMDIVLDATLFVRGTPEKSRIDGNITLLEGSYFKNVNLNLLDGAVSKKRKTTPTPTDINAPFLKNMTLNVSLRHRSPFVVNNNLAQMEIAPDLKLIGTVNRPVINGRAQIQSGTLVYRGKTFTINKGVIDFLNPYAIEPTIDVQSTSQVREWLISLGISGTPDTLAFTLSSNPALEDGDILSLLLTGRTSAEMIKSESGSTQSATQMLAQILASKMDDDIKRTTGLDIFEAQVNGASDTGSAGEVKVSIGKELSRRMTVKYAMETEKGEMIQKALAEYKFLEDMLVSGFQDNRGRFGGSVKYRLEFR